jgi:tRNA 5-methylaminomethyl-2-thiouridine biosynthesis bifunctional protein
VIGAGLAGSAASARLAARGWRITLLERHAGPAREASGNLAGIVRPLLSLDDNIASRFTRAAYLHALRAWAGLFPAPRWSPCGVLQIARDAAHAEQQRRVVAAHAYPADYVRWLDRDQAASLLGLAPAEGGWLFPGGGWANPPSVCAANLAACADRLEARYGADVARLERSNGAWRAMDRQGRVIAAAPVLVLAGGADALQVLRTGHLPMKRVRGQVTHLPADRLPPLPLAVCREGYVAPAVDGRVCVGASYDFDAEPAPRPEENAGNLVRLEQILPGAAAGLDPLDLQGRVGFRGVPPDRLPVVGALPAAAPVGLDREARLADIPRLEDCHGLLGLASRGLVWAQLAAELLASRLEGDPWPLETDLADALDPARFILRRLRRGRPPE